MTAPAQAGVLPGWVAIDQAGGGLSLMGWVREVEQSGIKFLELRTGPDDDDRMLRMIAIRRIDGITPVSEETARKYLEIQWGGKGR